MQYIKDRTEGFDDYFPCSKEKCKLNHVRNWLNLFVKIHNKEVQKLVESFCKNTQQGGAKRPS